MDVHEDFRNCLIAELMLKLNGDTQAVQTVVSVFDSLLNDFDVHRKEKQLVVYQNPIPKLVQLYLSIKELEGLSKGTIDAYRLGLYRFFLFCNKQPEEVAPADIRNWVLYIRSTGRVCDRTLNGYIGIIEYFYNWALKLGYVQKVPTAVIPKIKYEKKQRGYLSQIELQYIRDACETLREKALIEFLYSTGCRVSEVVGVKLCDLNWENNTVHVFGKGRKHRNVFINAKCEVALKKYIASRNDQCEYIFASERTYAGQPKSLTTAAVNKIIKQIVARIDGFHKPVYAHLFRHTTATTAIQNGMPIEDICQLLGHESVATTMIYAKTTESKVQREHNRCVI